MIAPVRHVVIFAAATSLGCASSKTSPAPPNRSHPVVVPATTSQHASTDLPTRSTQPPLISAGSFHTCALDFDGRAYCWGRAQEGQFAPPSGRFTRIAAGHNFTCGVRGDHTVACWGDAPDESWLRAPEGRFVDVAVGATHACAIRTNRTVTCWGSNKVGQLDAPAKRVVRITLGGLHGCALTAERKIDCWGRNRNGEANAPSGTFVDMSASLGATWTGYSCGVTTGHKAVCWGVQRFVDSVERDVPALPLFPPGLKANQIAAGGTVACALDVAGIAVCDLPMSETPPPGQHRAITAGANHVCGIRRDNSIWCFGDNADRQCDVPKALR